MTEDLAAARLLDAMTAYVRRQRPETGEKERPVDPVAVNYREYGVRTGYCHTCADSNLLVAIECTDANGEVWTYVAYEHLEELIHKLTDEVPADLPREGGYDWPHEDQVFDDGRWWLYGWHRGKGTWNDTDD